VHLCTVLVALQYISAASPPEAHRHADRQAEEREEKESRAIDRHKKYIDRQAGMYVDIQTESLFGTHA
jgi:hypothetical protein